MATALTNAETMPATRGGTANPVLILAFCCQFAGNTYSACLDTALNPQMGNVGLQLAGRSNPDRAMAHPVQHGQAT